jgi:hypothetical protein
MWELGVWGGMQEHAMINPEAQDHASPGPLFARLLGQLAPACMRLAVRPTHLDAPSQRMALDHIARAPGQVRCQQRTRRLCARRVAGHDQPFGAVGADLQPRTANHHPPRCTAPDADGLRRTGMGRNIVRDVRCALLPADGLRATSRRDDLHAPAQRRGAGDKGRRAIEGSRRATGPRAGGLWRREWCEQAPRECLLGGLGRMGRWLRRPLLWGDALLLESLRLLIPGAELGGGLSAGQADRDGAGRCEHEEQEQTLPPASAPACLVAALVQMGERVSCVCAWVVGLVDDETATGQRLVGEDPAHTRPQACVPGHLAVAKHPCQGCQRRGPEAGAGKACPANGVGSPHGWAATREPRTRHRGQAMAWTMLADRLVHRLDTSADDGCRRCNEQGAPHG